MAGRSILIACLCAALAGACARYETIAPGRVTIGQFYSVAPSEPWSRREKNGLEYWTIDGPLLHRVILFPGVSPGRTLFPVRGTDRRRKRKFRPKFDAAMSPPEIAEFFEASMLRSGAVAFRMRRAAPAKFGTEAGFQFDFDYAATDGIERSGFAVGTVHDGKLLIILHFAVREHYAAAHAKRAARLIATVQLIPPAAP